MFVVCYSVLIINLNCLSKNELIYNVYQEIFCHLIIFAKINKECLVEKTYLYIEPRIFKQNFDEGQTINSRILLLNVDLNK